LAILGLWVPGPQGGLLEELSEPEKEMTRKAKAQAAKARRKSSDFLLQM
jgi:hypothetical protein